MHRIALGTVQFGLSYGVANNKGQTSYQESKKIVKLAQQNGVNTLDTAVIYGSSEETLGKIGVDGWKIITKLPEISSEPKNIQKLIHKQITDSLRRLKVSKLYAVLLHDSGMLSSKNGEVYWDTLHNLKGEGIVQKIGYSIYTPDELDTFYERFYPDIIQAPFNIIDNRLDNSGWLQRMSDDQVEIHARSIFLQGLLLMKQNKRPSYFKQWDSLWESWHRYLKEEDITAIEASLGYVMSDSRIDKLVIGVDCVAHLQQIINLSKEKLEKIPNIFSSKDQKLINPSMWNL